MSLPATPFCRPVCCGCGKRLAKKWHDAIRRKAGVQKGDSYYDTIEAFEPQELDVVTLAGFMRPVRGIAHEVRKCRRRNSFTNSTHKVWLGHYKRGAGTDEHPFCTQRCACAWGVALAKQGVICKPRSNS